MERTLFISPCFRNLGLWLACWLVAGALGARPLVILDAAHGGSDPGSKAGSEVEKQWNMKIAHALEAALKARGIEAAMVRKGDETILDERRAEIINTSQASVAVIIHADREWTGTQTGPIVVVEPPNRPDAGAAAIPEWGVVTPSLYRSSLRLARTLFQHLGLNQEFSNLSDSRGASAENSSAAGRIFCMPHQSLRNLTVPAVVLTPLFLTSSLDVKKYSKDEALSELAGSIAQGIADYLRVSP